VHSGKREKVIKMNTKYSLRNKSFMFKVSWALIIAKIITFAIQKQIFHKMRTETQVSFFNNKT
jgi:hypothetical protein